MSIILRINPFEFFVDRDGSPLDAGYIYIGEANKDPRSYPVALYYDEDLTIPATQPLRTTNGYIARNNAPTFLFVNGNYSILVQDKWQRQVYYVADALLVGNSAAVSTGDLANTDDISLGDAMVGVKQPFTGAVAQTQHQKNTEILSVRDFGAKASNTAAANLTAFKAAVAAVPDGGVLTIPVDAAGPYVIDTSGGLSTAIVVDRRMTLRFEGDVKANFGTMQANPPYIFKVTATGVSFIGSGSIIGNGSIDDTNAGDETTFPGLVYVTGSRFNMVGMTIDTPPKLGVLLMNCSNARIANCNFIGGPTAYTTGHTAYFGVRAYLGSHHILEGNHFAQSPSGGKAISCIFGLQSHYMTVIGNTANAVWEKMTYLYGNGNRVIGNVVNDTTITDAFRFGGGSYNQLIGNVAREVNGGTQVFDGVFNLIANNVFVGCRQIGINVTRSDPAYVGGFSGTKVINNICVGGSGTKTDGIRVFTDGADSADIDVSGNTVSNFAQTLGEGLIRVMAGGAFNINNSKIEGNVMDTGLNGIVLDRVIDSVIRGNQGKAIANYFLMETGCAGLRWLDNTGRSIGTIGISGLSSTSYGRGNQYTSKPLIGAHTMVASAVNTVTHGGVAPNARIIIQEIDETAGVAEAVKGRYFTGVSGNNFTIATANGTAAAGTEQFFYEIMQ